MYYISYAYMFNGTCNLKRLLKVNIIDVTLHQEYYLLKNGSYKIIFSKSSIWKIDQSFIWPSSPIDVQKFNYLIIWKNSSKLIDLLLQENLDILTCHTIVWNSKLIIFESQTIIWIVIIKSKSPHFLLAVYLNDISKNQKAHSDTFPIDFEFWILNNKRILKILNIYKSILSVFIYYFHPFLVIPSFYKHCWEHLEHSILACHVNVFNELFVPKPGSFKLYPKKI